MVNMWASDVAMIRLCANSLKEWGYELRNCKETAGIAKELEKIEKQLYRLQAKAKSEQTPPDQLGE